MAKSTKSTIIKTDTQKFEGEYYTPLNFVREVHKRLEKLQPDYLEIPTWDTAAGIKNLTKEFDYKRLISSTLNDNEADVQYDYLNEIELKEPIEAIVEQGKEMKKFNFICNPPYATAGNNKRDAESKTGVSFTKVRELIQKEKTHTCFARNLSTQFLWRIIKFYEDNHEIEEGTITWIAPLLMLSSSGFTKLRERLFSLFDFVDGFMIDAGEFDGIKKGSWSIGFSIFKLNRKKEKVNLDGGGTVLNSIFNQNRKERTENYIHLTSSLQVVDIAKYKALKNTIGILVPNGNNIESNAQSVYIMNGLPKANFNTFCITKSNFHKAIQGFCARALIKANLINEKDEYFTPFSQKPTSKFKFDILENTEEGIVQVGEKEVYNLDGGEDDFKSWLQSFSKGKKKDVNYPKFSSALNVKNSNQGGGIYEKCFAMFANGPSMINKNAEEVYIVNGAMTSNWGICGFDKENTIMMSSAFCARRLIENEVYNWNDEYLKPSDTILQSDDYKQWSNDCIIYSLFDNKSNQSSLRQVTYQSKQWNIKNEFFFMSKDEIKDLAALNSNDKVLADLELYNEERFVYEEIKRIREEGGFSQEALNLLDYMRYMVATTFPKRLESKPEHHFNSWDAGYSQIKLYMTKEELKEFKEFRTILADKLRPKVYYFGFLYDPAYKHWTDDVKVIVKDEEGNYYHFVNDKGEVLMLGMLN